MKKVEARQAIKAQKKALTEQYKQEASAQALAKLESLDIFKDASNVLMYNSLPDELRTTQFLDKWHNTKNIYLPRVNGDDLEILRYNPEAMHKGSFNIDEPDGDCVCSIDDIDLIVVPGVAFDSKCNRVGRGKGYYDRLLSANHATTVGIAYDFQVVDNIDVEPHDVPLDILITDKHTYKSTN
jgi:5-formyltetrahydrofolate cyclo-ligase